MGVEGRFAPNRLAMRHLIICTLLGILPIPVVAQTTDSSLRPRQERADFVRTAQAPEVTAKPIFRVWSW